MSETGLRPMALPDGWEVLFDEKLQRPFYIDHTTKSTTWVDPRERYSKKATFALCDTHELPYGWVRAVDPCVGEYFIDHNTWTTHLPEDMEVYFAQQRGAFQRIVLDQRAVFDAHQQDVQQLQHNLRAALAKELRLQAALDTGSAGGQMMLRTQLAELRLSIQELSDRLDRKKRGVAANAKGLGILETEFASMNERERPFFNHVADAQAKLHELERLTALTEQQMMEKAEVNRYVERQLLAAALQPDEFAHRERQRLQECESTLMRQHLQQMQQLKTELIETRSHGRAGREQELLLRLNLHQQLAETRSSTLAMLSIEKRTDRQANTNCKEDVDVISVVKPTSETASTEEGCNLQQHTTTGIHDTQKNGQNVLAYSHNPSFVGQERPVMTVTENMDKKVLAKDLAQAKHERAKFRQALLDMRHMMDEQKKTFEAANSAIERDRQELKLQKDALVRERQRLEALASSVGGETDNDKTVAELQRQTDAKEKRRKERTEAMQRLRRIEELNRSLRLDPLSEDAKKPAPLKMAKPAAVGPAVKATPPSILVDSNTAPKELAQSTEIKMQPAGSWALTASSLAHLQEETDQFRSRSGSSASTTEAFASLEPSHWGKFREVMDSGKGMKSWLDECNDPKLQSIFANKSEVDMVITLRQLMKKKEEQDSKRQQARGHSLAFAEKLKRFEPLAAATSVPFVPSSTRTRSKPRVGLSRASEQQ